MRSKALANFPNCILPVAAGMLILLGSSVGKGQTTPTEECKWENDYVHDYVQDLVYNPATNQNEIRYTWKYVWKPVLKCAPKVGTTPSSSSITSGKPRLAATKISARATQPKSMNGAEFQAKLEFYASKGRLIMNTSDNTLRPAGGHQWINPDDPKNYEVKLLPGLVESKLGEVSPAKGYRWVNPKNPKDFRVERMP